MADQLEMLIDSLDHTSIVVLRELEKALKHVHLLEEENHALRRQLSLQQEHAYVGQDVAPVPAGLEAEEGEVSSCQALGGDQPGLPDVHSGRDASSTASGLQNEDDTQVAISPDHVNEAVSSSQEAGQPSEAIVQDKSAEDKESLQPDTAAEREHGKSELQDEDLDNAETDNAPSPQALLKEWYGRYPQAFFTAHTRPLKVGIHKDLIEREPWPAKLIRRALANYVNLPRYLKSVRLGAQRVDLDGQAVGAIGEEDVQHAREQLELLQTRRREREERQASERMSRKLEQLSARLGH